MGDAGSYGMYLASQSGLVSSLSNTAGVTQYDDIQTQTRASAPSGSPQGSMMPGSALTPEAGTHAFMHSCIPPKLDSLEGQICAVLSSFGSHGVLLWITWVLLWQLACQPSQASTQLVHPDTKGDNSISV